MKLNITFLYTCVLFITASNTSFAQQESMLSQMNKSWQFNSINPAFFPEEKRIAVGLPSFGVDAFHSGTLTYNDFIKNVNGKKQVDFEQIISKLEPENNISYRQRFETFSVGLRLPGIGKTAVSISHAIRLNSNTSYTKEMVQLFWGGNAQFIGQTIQIAPVTRTFDWHEIGLNVSRSFGKFRVGGRIKYLAGISSLITDTGAQKLEVTTSNDIYQLNLNTDYGVFSSGIISAIDTSGLGFNVTRNQLKNKFSGANSGLAFDVGVVYNINDKLTIHASVLDLSGSIRWEAANYFKSKASYDFEGVTLPGADIINGADDLDFSAKVDTLNDIFKFSKTTVDYTTAVPTRCYAGARYEITKRLAIAGSVFYETGFLEDKLAFSFSAHFQPIKLLNVGILYAANKNKAANIGAQITLSPGPVQFFIASDNLNGALKPYGSSRVNFRTGLAFLM
jgi:Family of unknown function (DUF5723)